MEIGNCTYISGLSLNSWGKDSKVDGRVNCVLPAAAHHPGQHKSLLTVVGPVLPINPSYNPRGGWENLI